MNQIDPLKHKGLVYMVLNSHSWLYGSRSSWEKDDAYQEGMICLMEALKTYDITQGALSSYCINRIKWGLFREYKRQRDLIRKPDGLQDQYNVYLKAVKAYKDQYSQTPADEYMAAVLKIPLDTIKEMKLAFVSTVSLDIPLNSDDEEMTIGDTIEDERDDFTDVDYHLMISQLRKDLDRMMNHKLNYLDQELTKSYFGWNGGKAPSYGELGEKYHLTYDQVRSRIMKSLQTMRTYRAELTRNYPELITRQVYAQTWNQVGEIRRMVGSTVSKFLKLGSPLEIDNRFGVVTAISHDCGHFDFKCSGVEMRYHFTSFRDIEMQDRHIRKLFTNVG